MILRLNAWQRRRPLRLTIYGLLILAGGLALGARYRHYLNTPRLTVPPPIGAGASAWFRPREGSLTRIDVQDLTTGDMEITYWALWTMRGHAGPDQIETLVFGVKVLRVQPREAADRARSTGLDIPIALARTLWMPWGGEPEVIRPSDDPNTVFLRARNPDLVRTNGLRYAGAWLPWTLLMLALALSVGETLAYAGRRLFPLGHCRHCGYPMADLPGAICPECGRAG